MQVKHFQCYDCKEIIEFPYGKPKPLRCPKCGSINIHRVEKERGPRWFGKQV